MEGEGKREFGGRYFGGNKEMSGEEKECVGEEVIE
jgi:hypothetical protein